MIVPLEGDSTPEDLIATEYLETMPAISRNGKWLAYESNVTGQREIWVRPYPGPGPPTRISSNGGTDPVWGKEDREILYLEGPKLMAAKVQIGEELRIERAEMLFEGKYVRYPNAPRPYDVAPDGRLLMVPYRRAHTESKDRDIRDHGLPGRALRDGLRFPTARSPQRLRLLQRVIREWLFLIQIWEAPVILLEAKLLSLDRRYRE